MNSEKNSFEITTPNFGPVPNWQNSIVYSTAVANKSLSIPRGTTTSLVGFLGFVTWPVAAQSFLFFSMSF